MRNFVSPRYQMNLVKSVEEAIRKEYKTNREVLLYIEKWHEGEGDRNRYNSYSENFTISYLEMDGGVDLNTTLHSMQGDDLLRIAIDLGVETPDFIPSIPMFKNELKSDYRTAYETFDKACKQVDSDPSQAIGLVNSALESIIKEIMKDYRISNKIKNTFTTSKLSQAILKEFKLTDSDMPTEIKTIGSSLLAICKAIEDIRSDKTHSHGKTEDDYIITDRIYSNFVVNSVATVGLFLNSYYQQNYPKPSKGKEEDLLF